MNHRPTIGSVGRTLSVMSPEGEAEFDGASFQVRAEGANIDSGRHVFVTGFDPWVLIVREATAEEIASQPTRTDETGPSVAGRMALWVVGAVTVGILVVVGSLLSFAVGGLAGFGYLLAMAGQLWLLGLMVRECQPDAIGLALVIPFFTWYFAWQRWDVAKWPFLFSVIGLGVNLVGVLNGV
jgi:membrane-bound ClpP family serine protease